VKVSFQPPPAFSRAEFSIRELGSGHSLFPAAIFVPAQGFRLPLVFAASVSSSWSGTSARSGSTNLNPVSCFSSFEFLCLSAVLGVA
jgi:hypothetical protein